MSAAAHSDHGSRGADDRDLERARESVALQLATRQVAAHDDDAPEALVRVLEAVEAFEREVVGLGGDLMTNQLATRNPDDPRFVLPSRGEDEGASAYERRVREATQRLRRDD